MEGKTGRIMFDETGRRVNYTLHLFKHGGMPLLKQVWSNLLITRV